MKTYLQNAGAAGSAALEEIKIFNLTVCQREHETAFVKLLVKKEDAFSITPLYINIIIETEDGQKHLLFKGKRVGFPRKIAEDLAEVEYTSEPDDEKDQLKKLAETQKTPVFYDELFITPGDENPTNVLEARSDLFCWDRCSGVVSISNLFEGQRILDFSNDILQGSLKLSLGDTPIDSITVEIAAEWIQKAEGQINLFPQIAKKFPKRLVNTLTPEQLAKQWPRVGDKIGPFASLKQSGYQVVASKLKLFNPPHTGVLDIYPTVTPLITTLIDNKPESVRLKRFWFKGELWLCWHYFQKRREVVHFTLHQSSQLKGHIRAKHKTLRLQLQSVENALVSSASSSFFISQRGESAIMHALEIAKSHLAGSSRCIEIEFEVPLVNAIEISLKDAVTITSDKIPGGTVVGKIIEYMFLITSTGAIARIRLGVAAGSESVPSVVLTEDSYFEASYCQDVSLSLKSPSGIVVKQYYNQTPKAGILQPYSLGLHDFIKQIEIKGDAEKQAQHLLENEYPIRENPISALIEVPTIIDVELLDLRTAAMLEHHIHLDVLNAWSAPSQINF